MVVDKSYLEESEEDTVCASNIASLKDMARFLSEHFGRYVEGVLLHQKYIFSYKHGWFKRRKAVGHVKSYDVEHESSKNEITIYCYSLETAELLDKHFGELGYTFCVCEKLDYYDDAIFGVINDV